MAYDDPGRRFRPANGTEGTDFLARWCERCAKDDGVTSFGDPSGRQCDILALSYVEEVAEWVYGPTRDPICTAWVARPPNPGPLKPKPYRCPETLDLFAGAR